MDETYIAYCKTECCWQASGSVEYRMNDKAYTHTEDTGHSTEVTTEDEWFKL